MVKFDEIGHCCREQCNCTFKKMLKMSVACLTLFKNIIKLEYINETIFTFVN